MSDTLDTAPPVPTPADVPAPLLPEGAHSSRFVHIDLPEFNQPGVPPCWVELRNIGLMSQEQLEAIGADLEAVEVDSKGLPVDFDKAAPALYGQIMRLIRSWSMWDAGSDEDIPAQLPSPPATIADLKRAPAGALQRLIAAVGELKDPQ